MTVYDSYKPLRNYVAQFDLRSSLEHAWLYFQHLLNNAPLPVGFIRRGQIQIKDNVHPWELSLLVRELLLHGKERGKRTLGTHRDLIDAINQIRRVDEAISAQDLDSSRALAELHRIAHRQFPWQQRRDMAVLIRYLKIFGADDVEAVVIRETGLTMTQLYFMGIATAGHLVKYPGFNTQQDYSGFGIDACATKVFFEKMSIGSQTLRERIRDVQSYDGRWQYTWNPLEATPLVSLDTRFPNLVHCPVPAFLLRRISQGVFYDLIKSVDFDNPYGRAFQAYVGDVFRELCPGPRYSLMDEAEYKVGRQVKHGVDWIVGDGSASLFVECKTKRLRHDAKISIEGEVLEAQLNILAEAIVQLYKNIGDAVDGKTNWAPNQLPIYPLVVTLEEWYLFSPLTTAYVHRQVKTLLERSCIDPRVADDMPYTVASIDEMELVGQIFDRTGLGTFFARKTESAHRHTMLAGFAWTCFEEHMRDIKRTLFSAEWERFLPDTAEGWIRNLRGPTASLV